MDIKTNEKGTPVIIHKNHVIVDEKCLINNIGDYIGIETGLRYPKKDYEHSEIIYAEVVFLDRSQDNGMIHLDTATVEGKDAMIKKAAFIGCIMPFRSAHTYGDNKVYQSLVTGEYYNDLELEFIV